MASITVTSTHGDTRTIPAATGLSVMEVIRKAGFDDLQALCGGSCSCATCHVIVHPDDFGRVGPPAEDENDLLDSSDRAHAHLAPVLPDPLRRRPLEGLRVTIARGRLMPRLASPGPACPMEECRPGQRAV